jgi:dihydroorotase-like cyclic amidohydrolase
MSTLTSFPQASRAESLCRGEAAALAGGTTMILDFALPVNGDVMAGFERHSKRAQRSCMDYGFHMAITKWDEQVAKDMEAAVAAGVNSFKFFMAYKVRSAWTAATCCQQRHMRRQAALSCMQVILKACRSF